MTMVKYRANIFVWISDKSDIEWISDNNQSRKKTTLKINDAGKVLIHQLTGIGFQQWYVNFFADGLLLEI